MCRGSREYGCFVMGSKIEQTRLMVGTAENGSILTMSDALIGCQPRIDEPSNAKPSSNRAVSRRYPGICVCCHTPGKSMNFKSTYLTSCFFASSITSLGVILPPETFLYATDADCTPPARSNSFLASFARTNAYGFIDLNDEYLSVPDAT